MTAPLHRRHTTVAPPLHRQDARDGNDGTVLFYASASHQMEMVKLLLANGASPNLAVKNGMTPIIANALRDGGNVEIFEVLVGAGADPLLPDLRGATPLHYAASKGNEAASAYLISKVLDCWLDCWLGCWLG